MAKFYNISAGEMREFLQAEKGWRELIQGREIVFSYNLKSNNNICIKVYSGILANNNQSRGCGQDAIRVCAVNVTTNKGWIKTARVHRVEGWKNNLKNRVLKAIQQSNARLKNN